MQMNADEISAAHNSLYKYHIYRHPLESFYVAKLK